MEAERLVRTFGGQDLWRRERAWDGLTFEHARWLVEGEATGLTRWPEHLLYVTFAGRTRRTSARIEDGERYDGADFPGATTFVPSLRERTTRFQAGTIEYAAIRIDPVRLPELPDSVEFVGVTNRPDPLVRQLCLALGDRHSDQLFADSVASTLLLHLVRRYSNRAHAARPEPRPPRLSARALGAVLDYIGDHLASDLRLAVLARIAGLDRHSFTRAFKAATGSSPHQYVLERRLERAAGLLATRRELPIAEIAYRTGFSSQSHLTTAFRRRYGATPNAYRRARCTRLAGS